jgi:hypothetical protein
MGQDPPISPPKTKSAEISGGFNRIADAVAIDGVGAEQIDTQVFSDEVDVSVSGDGTLRYVEVRDEDNILIQDWTGLSGSTFNSTFDPGAVGRVSVGYDASSDSLTVDLRQVYLPTHDHEI